MVGQFKTDRKAKVSTADTLSPYDEARLLPSPWP